MVAPKKKRKDGMPKKHDPKKKRGVTMSQKKGERDRDDSREKSHYLKE